MSEFEDIKAVHQEVKDGDKWEIQCRGVYGCKAPVAHDARDWLIDKPEEANGLLWYAWHEFNTIRARDGAPIGISHEFWDEMTKKMNEFLGGDSKPWPSDAAKKIFKKDDYHV